MVNSSGNSGIINSEIIGFGGASIDLTFDNTTISATDPGQGKIKLNNATQYLSTQIYLDNLDDQGVNFDNFLNTFDSVTSTIKGHIRITKKTDPLSFILFQISDLTNNTGWWTINISNAVYSTQNPFINLDDILISFVANGDIGTQGSVGDIGPQGSAGGGGGGGTGTQGDQGEKGEQGDTGPNGAASTTAGPAGPTGSQGTIGPTGPKGDQGEKGEQGDTGPNGAASTTAGPAGPTGIQGEQGEEGEEGTIGTQGTQGTQGTCCFDIYTNIQLNDNSIVHYGSLTNETVNSLTIEGITNTDDEYLILNEEIEELKVTLNTSVVVGKRFYTFKGYFNINNILKVTADHCIFVKQNNKWGFKKVWTLNTNDKMYSLSGEEINIDSIIFVDEWINVCLIDVEEIDNYFISDLNILVHNCKHTGGGH